MKNTGKRLLWLLMAVTILLTVTACGKPDDTASAPAENAGTGAAVSAKEGEGEVYAFCLSVHQLEFFDAAKAGIYDATQKLGATWYVAGPQEFDTAAISDAIDQAVAAGVTGIVVHGQSDDTADAITRAMEAGVPVICIDTDIGTDRLSFIGANPETLGVKMAEDMAEALGGEGKIIISGLFSQPSCVRCVNAIKSTFADNYPGIEIVAEVDDGADTQMAATKIGAAIQANPDVDGIIGTQAPTGIGAATAVREAGLQGKVKIVARDRDQATLDLIRSGEIESSWCTTSYVEAYTAIMWLHRYVNDELPVVENYRELGINPLPEWAEGRMLRIDKTNVDAFARKYEYKITAAN